MTEYSSFRKYCGIGYLNWLYTTHKGLIIRSFYKKPKRFRMVVANILLPRDN